MSLDGRASRRGILRGLWGCGREGICACVRVMIIMPLYLFSLGRPSVLISFAMVTCRCLPVSHLTMRDSFVRSGHCWDGTPRRAAYSLLEKVAGLHERFNRALVPLRLISLRYGFIRA